MKIGVFDSGLGGLTVVKAISEKFKGADIFYIADTQYAPYGDKTQNEIKQRCVQITEFLINKHNIEALIVACNTATSAAIKYLRQTYKELIVIGTEPGIKPALSLTKSSHVAVLATKATLKGEKYQQLVKQLSEGKNITLYEKACVGLVEQIEKGEINSEQTYNMLNNWLLPMKKNGVDTIVLGCTHYPLVSEIIKDIMGNEINLIETGEAIANRLIYLSSLKGHNDIKPLKISICHTGDINKNMINKIFKNYKNKIEIRKCKI
ncbi:glutamate racemase [Arcobacter sp. CECT 8985]|uniref:glutamate racemase n=1 Tax=Arcobacter sp. CECT 8985 TaxID=1935424 RepID=UPI00100B3471|nr:glutamate racemase [Arcobacter sp. CECT 8985]RXJ87766.1 glutamate racemase [Arcobacter sp. CECT 8985]